jgi:hypothetical protein
MNNFTNTDPLVSIASSILSEAQLNEKIVTVPAYYARGEGKYIGKELVDDKDLGSEVDTVVRQVERLSLLDKYIEVRSGSDSIRGLCVGFAYVHENPMLLIKDSDGKEIWIDAYKAQRKIYAFTPKKKEVTTTGTGSSDNPMLYSFGKTNY